MRVDDLSLAECHSYDNRPQHQAGRLRFRCPRHGGDHQKSLSVEEETGHFHCFNAQCGIWGTVLEKQPPRKDGAHADSGWGRTSGWRANSGVGSHSDPTSAVWVSPPPRALTSERPQPLSEPQPLKRNDAAVKRAVNAWKSFGGSPAQAYAHRRGVTDETAHTFHLGYWRGRWGDEESEWLTFPLRCPLTGKPVAVYGRNIHSDEQDRKGRVFGSKGLFGATQIGPMPPDVVLVEGPFDALACLVSPGLPPARSVIGASARAEWFDDCQRVVLAFDDDDSGIAATERFVADMAARRGQRGYGAQVLCLKPEALQQRHGVKDFGKLLERGVPIKLNLPPTPSHENDARSPDACPAPSAGTTPNTGETLAMETPLTLEVFAIMIEAARAGTLDSSPAHLGDGRIIHDPLADILKIAQQSEPTDADLALLDALETWWLAQIWGEE